MENNHPSSPEESEKDLISGYVEEIRGAGMEEHRAAVKKARNALFLVSVLVFISEMVSMFMAENAGFNWIILVIALIEAGVFVALALWTRKKPYNAIIGGLVAFIGIVILSAAVNGYVDGITGALKTLSGGIILKIFVLITLSRALRNAKELQKFQQDNRF